MKIDLKKISSISKNLAFYLIIIALLVFVIFIILPKAGKTNEQNSNQSEEEIIEKVIPTKGFALPVDWEDLGIKMTKEGVIDSSSFEKLYVGSPIGKEADDFISSAVNNKIVISQGNSELLLNLFWGLGLANKNPILETGPMITEGDTGNFASTGGWTIAKGSPMDHYSKHKFIVLNNDQQLLLEKISKNIYRPCCNNSTYFPDCNHGMAMLGLLELLVKNNVSEKEIYSIALKINSYWFPDTYLNIANYFAKKEGKSWEDVSQQLVLGKDYSSASGWQRVQNLIEENGISEIIPQGGGKCNL